MQNNNITHFLMVPFTGLGLYGGYRGNKWLKNRIKVFKQFVVPSLLAQTNKDFILWVAWRFEEKTNEQVIELRRYLNDLGLNVVFTFSGCPFWDDKYDDMVARERLINAVHGSLGDLMNIINPSSAHILMTIQPSDDCYDKDTVKRIQETFNDNTSIQAVTYKTGYICNYQTKELAEYVPATNPPFFTIKFPVEVFKDPLKHVEYTGPYKSHEYVGEKLNLKVLLEKGFLVGCHGENISTFFDHPFKKNAISWPDREFILGNFGLMNVPLLKINKTWRGYLFTKIPHYWRRKLRYYLGERFYARLYNIFK